MSCDTESDEVGMPFGGQEVFYLVSRFRTCAARLRSVAVLAPGGLITPEYVEELARELDLYADALEPQLEDRG